MSEPGRARRRLAFAAYLVVATLALLEIGLRLLTVTTGTGQRILSQPLLPWPLPPARLADALATPPDRLPYLVPDPWFGWTIKADGRHDAKHFAADALGLRSRPTPIRDPKPASVRRILLLGDSFVHGDEVRFDDTIGARLQERLGDAFEVLNGAVPAYGTDQAVLRYERVLGPRLAPDVVVLGIVRDDVPRNVNLFRALLFQWTTIPWSKPRFVLDGDELQLVNAPTVPPERVVDVLTHFADSPLRAYERCWFPAFYAVDWRDASRTWRLLGSQWVFAKRRRSMAALLDTDGEGTRVTTRIAQRFAATAALAGARPLVILIPQADDVAGYAPGGTPPLGALRDAVAESGVPLLDLGPRFAGAIDPPRGDTAASFFVGGAGHPNARATALVADALAEWVVH